MRKRLPIAGSSPQHPAELVRKESLATERRIRVTVVLRRPQADGTPAVAQKVQKIARTAPQKRAPLSRAELAELNAATKTQRSAFEKFARDYDLELVRFSKFTRDVVLEGSVKAINRAFGIELEQYDYRGTRFHSHRNEIRLPKKLHPLVEDVLGLDDTPRARHNAVAGTAPETTIGFTPPQLAKIYRFPTTEGPSNQRIAVLEFGGGFYPSDLETYWDSLDPGATPRALLALGGRRLQRPPALRHDGRNHHVVESRLELRQVE